MSELAQQMQRIYVLLDDGERRALRSENLTPTQFTLLRCVAEDTSHALSISRLAEMLLCTRGNVTRLVRRLELLGLVSTRGHDQDQRLVLVSLTSKGSRRLGKARHLLDAVNARRLHGMSQKELKALSELTDTLAGILAKDLASLGDAAEEG
jgi:MarR family 2-MHQ and catechol resistance regulon transcriptional repressor